VPDLRATGFDWPNPYGLLAADFDHDLESYDACLKFLSDFAGGTPEERALAINGGSRELMRSWESSRKFRRVLKKCREFRDEEEAYRARKQESLEPALWPLAGRLDQRFDPYRVHYDAF
jgi:hypothetical protein